MILDPPDLPKIEFSIYERLCSASIQSLFENIMSCRSFQLCILSYRQWKRTAQIPTTETFRKKRNSTAVFLAYGVESGLPKRLAHISFIPRIRVPCIVPCSCPPLRIASLSAVWRICKRWPFIVLTCRASFRYRPDDRCPPYPTLEYGCA